MEYADRERRLNVAGEFAALIEADTLSNLVY
jgi:hypothetical protein